VKGFSEQIAASGRRVSLQGTICPQPTCVRFGRQEDNWKA
jgi:hypothetical protein